MTCRSITVAVGFLLLVTARVWAIDIFTPPLPGSGADVISCIVLNTGKTAASNVGISIHDSNGTVQTSTTTTLAPGGTATIGDSTPNFATYCRVSGISRRRARVTLCAREPSGLCVASVTVP